MKSSDVANKYGISEFEVNKHIEKFANFPYKESLFGTITFSDDVDIETFFQPLI